MSFYSVATVGTDLTVDPDLHCSYILIWAENLVSETDTSDEDEEDDDDDESDSDYDASCEESGLGLLARFAASALPVSSTPLTILHDGKHRSRQSTLGKTTD